MARTPNTFRLQGKSIFLTYPKCPLIPLFVIDYLFHLLNDFKITYARVCQETHQDGELHLHCLVQLDEKFSTRNPRFFDITDPNRESTYHPNAQIPRRDADVADYIAKGGVFEERGLLRASRRSPKKSRDTIWGKIIDESTNAEEFLGRCQREQPYTYATQLRNLEYMANKKWPKPSANFTPKFSIFNGVPEPIKNWVEQNICVVHRDFILLDIPQLTQNDLDFYDNMAQESIEQILENPDNFTNIRPHIYNDSGPGE
uniref:Replication-associated protein n=1 Tax=Tomato apical leaf curl virus TaxID=2060142 RepID=A0A7G7NB27_9GEMI|nr:C1 [Tomato apical leaf curl virus]